MATEVLEHGFWTATAPFRCACGTEVTPQSTAVRETVRVDDADPIVRTVCLGCAMRRFLMPPPELALEPVS